MKVNNSVPVIGGGITGLAIGMSSGYPVYEMSDKPGGICSSYYKSLKREVANGSKNNRFRFEIGGGHWIFGGDPVILGAIDRIAPLKRYARKSSIFFCKQDLFIPYPIQNHLRYFPASTVSRILEELTQPAPKSQTMEEWMLASFGPTLCEIFFFPFHELYTAGLYHEIAPQDGYKSPVNLGQVIRGAFEGTQPVGYNTTYAYPVQGLDQLSVGMAQKCQIHYEKKLISIDMMDRIIFFDDGSAQKYDQLISTMPLSKTMEMAMPDYGIRADPYTSVLVLNIGAVKGKKCPDDHWLYNPDASSRFHRVGFYSNVDASFLPENTTDELVAIYVERAFKGGDKPSTEEMDIYIKNVIRELQDWEFIKDVEVVDPTWVEDAYTWSYPGSTWRMRALTALEERQIYQVGRYARWNFQGIAESIRDGLYTGSAMKVSENG